MLSESIQFFTIYIQSLIFLSTIILISRIVIIIFLPKLYFINPFNFRPPTMISVPVLFDGTWTFSLTSLIPSFTPYNQSPVKSLKIIIFILFLWLSPYDKGYFQIILLNFTVHSLPSLCFSIYIILSKFYYLWLSTTSNKVPFQFHLPGLFHQIPFIFLSTFTSHSYCKLFYSCYHFFS